MRQFGSRFSRSPTEFGPTTALRTEFGESFFQSLGREPDMDLLAPILEKLEELQASRDHGEPQDAA